MRPRTIGIASSLLFAAACSGGGMEDDVDQEPYDRVDDGCPAMFHQNVLAEYEVEIAPVEWAALEDEFLNRAANLEAGLDASPYHPIGFRYQGEAVPQAMIRLKGSSSWSLAIELDPDPKMQFVIAFNELDPEGRFLGVRKVELDMPRSDESFLRQRLGLYYLRSLGQQAQCANSARLVINGRYYGLYTNLERLDKEFLQRHFPDADDGDLWKGGRFIRTNEETFTWDRLDLFWHLPDLATLEGIADLEASVREWAAEAMLPHSDGYYMGRPNFYLYDHPRRGFLWLPHDLDSAFGFVPPDISPLYPEGEGRTANDREHYQLVLDEPRWLDRYVEDVAAARAIYDEDALAGRVEAWSAQISDSAADDPMKPFTTAAHTAAVDKLRAFLFERAAAVDAWLACRRDGAADADGDGFDSCYECDDDDPGAWPGAAETCNGVDDDCDGLADDVAGSGCP